MSQTPLQPDDQSTPAAPPLSEDTVQAFGFDLEQDDWQRRVHSALTSGDAALLEEELDRRGDRVGPYELLERIGSGGMGTVWRARRIDKRPDRIVALKLIRHGMDSRQGLRRFRLEEQVLARLEHPNIARLYDGGVTEQGRPYLVMEFVDGLPITTYAREHDLEVAENLELFREICAAVQYAHGSLVLHRDIKPSNILVTASGVPKLLDFGIARILDEFSDGSSAVTATDTRVLTPRYASPEQVRGERLTTLTDIYSLGVVLYEMLTGTSPYDVETGARTEFERAILDQDVRRPSTVPTSEVLQPASAHRRRARLRGDIDTIVMKALQKEPARRYASVELLAGDVDRHLRSLPILAAPDSMGYRVSRFVRRNRGLVGGVCVAGIAMLTATGVSISFALQELRARAEADQRTRTAETINAFLNDDLLASIDPDRTENPDLTVREALDRAAERVDGRFDAVPLVEAAIRHTIGWTYRNLGLAGAAVPHLRRATDLRQVELGDLDEETRNTMRDLVTALYEDGSGDEGSIVGRELILLDIEAVGSDSADAMDTRHLLARYGGIEEDNEAWLREIYAWNLEHRGYAHPETLSVMHTLANNYIHANRFDEAQPLLEDIWEVTTEHYGRSHSMTIDAMQGVAFLYVGTDRQDEAIEVLQEAVQILRETKPQNYPDMGIMLGHLGMFLADADRGPEAISALEEGYGITSGAFGPTSGWAFPLALKLSKLHRQQGDLEASAEWLERVPEENRPAATED